MASAPSRTTMIWFATPQLLNARSVSFSSVGLSSTRRICFVTISPRFSGEREVESRPPIDGGVGPDLSTVAVHDTLGRREADAGAGKLAHRMQTLKWSEQALCVAHVEAGTVV